MINKKHKGTIYLRLTHTTKLGIKPKILANIGMTLTLIYAIGVPVFDLRYKTSVIFGHYFLDAQHNTTTFDKYLYIASFLLLLVFSLVWAYGIFRYLKTKSESSTIATTAAVCVVIGVFLLYSVLSFYFGFKYHFVF